MFFSVVNFSRVAKYNAPLSVLDLASPIRSASGSLLPSTGGQLLASVEEQKTVLTPGQNQKHYLAGALHTRTGQVLWVGNGKKNSYLFLQLLRRVADAFPRATKLHVVLDNYGIHSSRLVKWALTEEFHGRIVLHFLPPYSPDHNRIERLWRELHANVTRNHRCATLRELLEARGRHSPPRLAVSRHQRLPDARPRAEGGMILPGRLGSLHSPDRSKSWGAI